MDTLPVELLDIIVQLCDYASKKNLRRMNKTFEDLTTHSIFGHHYTAMFDDSLLKFESIANSRLARHVNRLTYFNDTLPIYRKQQYMSNVDLRPAFHDFRKQRECEFPDEVQDWSRSFMDRTFVLSRAHDAWNLLPRHNLTKKLLERGWKEYSRLLKQQKGWGKNDQNARLQAAFMRLSNLVEVDVVRVTPEDRDASQWPVWRRLREDILLGPGDWREHYTARHERIDFGHVLETATLCLLEATAQRNRELVEGFKPVSVIRLQNDVSQPHSLVANWTNSLYGSAPESQQWAAQLIGPIPLADAFRHITTFTVRLADPGPSCPTHQMVAVWAQLHHFLSVASELRSLTLLLEGQLGVPRFDEDLDAWGGDEPAINIFKSKTVLWPHLEHLSLLIDCSSANLLRLLQLHSATLQSLEIHHSVLDDVPSFLSKLPKILALKHV